MLSSALPPWLTISFRNPQVDASGAAAASMAQPTATNPNQTHEATVRTGFWPRSARRESLLNANTVWVVWLLGSIASFSILFVGLMRLWWLAAHAREIPDGRWRALARELCRSYGIPRPVRLLESRESSLLVTWGWRRPTVLLPAAAREWPDDRVRVVLAHELAHIVRGDWTFQLAAEVLRSLHWFNPLSWITCARLRLESERACDDAVLARGVEAPEYATHLLDLARSLNRGRQPWLPAPAMARPSSLEGRVRAMLNTTLNRRPVSRPGRIATVGLLSALTLSLAALGAQSRFYSLSGTAFDPTNRVLPNTRIVLTNAVSQAKYEVRTDATGRFEFVGLPPAQYAMEAMLPGFSTLKHELTISGNTDRELRLRVGSLQETITVTDAIRPPAPPDAATLEKRNESRLRFQAMQSREKERCAGGGATSTAGGRILPPAKLVDVRPTYPENLRAAKVGGTVTMDAVIGTDGLVREVNNVKGPHPDLEVAAANAVRQWQFSATLLNCEPIDVDMKVTTSFTIGPS
jgi:TonB family protein